MQMIPKSGEKLRAGRIMRFFKGTLMPCTNGLFENKMKFHPQKFKVVPIAPPGKGLQDLFNKNFPLAKTFFYKLDDTELELFQ